MSKSNKIPHITCEHLQEIKEEDGPDHAVIDVRDTTEFDAGHIEGSHNVPRRELTKNIESVVPHKLHRVIVVVGITEEPEIEYIHDELTQLGYESVEFLAGGFDKWCEIAMPTVEDVLGEETPEEAGMRGDGTDDYEGEDLEEKNEPLL